jgi:hypothetical protein
MDYSEAPPQSKQNSLFLNILLLRVLVSLEWPRYTVTYGLLNSAFDPPQRISLPRRVQLTLNDIIQYDYECLTTR